MTSGSSRHKKALGKGLSALLPDSEVPGTGLGTSVMLRSDLIDSNPYQPRRVWDETELEALAGSIRAAGLLQPLIVRKKGARFQLIAGERRLRAARLAGLASVPAIVRDASEQEMLALALIENIQRRDLGPIEKAEAFRRLSEEFSLSQEQLAECVGMSRPAVANFMRLLELPESIKGMLSSGAISMGHGRALLGLAPDVAAMERVARKAAGSGLSVRQIEDAIGRIRKPRGKGGARKRTAGGAEARMLEHQLQRLLGTRVRVRDAKGKGTIEIAYSSLDELDRILDILGMNH